MAKVGAPVSAETRDFTGTITGSRDLSNISGKRLTECEFSTSDATGKEMKIAIGPVVGIAISPFDDVSLTGASTQIEEILNRSQRVFGHINFRREDIGLGALLFGALLIAGCILIPYSFTSSTPSRVSTSGVSIPIRGAKPVSNSGFLPVGASLLGADSLLFGAGSISSWRLSACLQVGRADMVAAEPHRGVYRYRNERRIIHSVLLSGKSSRPLGAGHLATARHHDGSSMLRPLRTVPPSEVGADAVGVFVPASGRSHGTRAAGVMIRAGGTWRLGLLPSDVLMFMALVRMTRPWQRHLGSTLPVTRYRLQRSVNCDANAALT